MSAVRFYSNASINNWFCGTNEGFKAAKSAEKLFAMVENQASFVSLWRLVGIEHKLIEFNPLVEMLRKRTWIEIYDLIVMRAVCWLYVCLHCVQYYFWSRFLCPGRENTSLAFHFDVALNTYTCSLPFCLGGVVIPGAGRKRRQKVVLAF